MLKQIKYIHKESEEYPFCLELIKGLDTIKFEKPITFFAGENGTGKSTLTEAIACGLELPTAGGEHTAYDETLKPARELSRSLKFTFDIKHKKGFLLRAEDFINFIRKINMTKKELQHELAQVEKNYKNSSEYGKMLVRGVFNKSINAIESKYDGDLEQRSHGEGFLDFFKARFIPGGIYILDEPEAALSPQSQYTLMMMISDMVKEGCQFIIATHSPILLAMPNATIFDVSSGTVEQREYDDLDNVQFYKAFFENKERYLRYLGE